MVQRRCLLFWSLMVMASGCGSPRGELPISQAAAVPTTQALERWSAGDDARLLGQPIEYRLAALPLDGQVAQDPWVGSYWPTYLDSINYRWAGPGSQSAPSKYQRAFGGTDMESRVSRHHGIDSVRGSSCSTYGSCAEGYKCALRTGRSQGSCLPLWWGLCHAWATASLLHPEPRHAVQYNGVTFAVSDLKALLTLVYNTSRTKQISGRCERDKRDLPADRAERPLEADCRDSNPGTYHLMLANYVGLDRRSFVEDRSIDRDVWNQPIRAYHVRKMHEISARKASRVLGVRHTDYPYNGRATRFAYVQTQVDFVREATAEIDGYLGDRIDKFTFSDVYEYVLELDAQGQIIGGEWAGRSKLNHPDFMWLPLGPNSSAVAGGAIRYDDVIKLVEMSY